MDDDPVRMRHQKAATKPRINWNIGPGYNRPEPVPQDSPFAQQAGQCPSPGVSLIRAYGGDQRSGRRPFEEALRFTAPIYLNGFVHVPVMQTDAIVVSYT